MRKLAASNWRKNPAFRLNYALLIAISNLLCWKTFEIEASGDTLTFLNWQLTKQQKQNGLETYIKLSNKRAISADEYQS